MFFIVIILFCFNGLNGMRERSLSLSSSGKRFSGYTKPRRSNSQGLKDSSIVGGLKKAFMNNQLNDDDVKSIEFLIRLYKDNKSEQKKRDGVQKRLSYEPINLDDIDKKDTTGRTILYKAIEQANDAIKEQGQLPVALEAKLCFLLINGADQDKECEVDMHKSSKSPRQIASSKIKTMLNFWKQEGYSTEKDAIVNKGLSYTSYSSDKS